MGSRIQPVALGASPDAGVIEGWKRLKKDDGKTQKCLGSSE